jgi:hypothetical protein
MFLGELITKITACCVLSGMTDDRDRNRYGLQRELVRADGIGDWAKAIDNALTGPGAQFLRDEFKDLQRELLQKIEENAWQYEALTLMRETLEILQLETDNSSSRPPLRQWFKWFALLRNKTRGHGAPLARECSSTASLLERSINLIVENLDIFKWQWAYLHRNLSGKYRVTALSKITEHFSYLKQSRNHSLPDGVYAFRNVPVQIELLESDPDITDFFVPNGQFRGVDYEVISYITNQKKRIDGKRWLTPATTLPNSETHGELSLDPQGNSLSNAPQPPKNYIERPELEKTLEIALIHDRHEIVTLGGAGGIGKTSLTLTVIKKLQSHIKPRFEVIVWFSARDIDLLSNGPKSVRPHGVSLDDFAKEYVNLTAPAESSKKGFNPNEFFSTALSTTPIAPTLYVFDNFETVTSPREVFKWIDTYIRPPNKILITTRTRDFVGDFPIEVLGMTESEAIQLIDSDAARLGISDLLTDEYRQALVNQSSGHPYVIKIMLGEVSKEKCLKKPERIIATQGQILQALFERTYSALSPAAQRIFLLLSTWRSIVPSLAIEAVVMRSADELIDMRSAIEELKRLSFIEEIAPAEGEEIFISLPLAALSFGQKKLNASALKAVIEADSELLQEFGAIRKEGTSSGIKIRISHLVKALAKRVASGKEELQSFRSMLEFVGSRVPAAWLDISRLYIEEGKEPGREWAKDALRRFIESDDDSTPKALIWQNLADLCNATADLQGEVQALVELANVSNTSTEDLSLIADRINRSFANAKRDGNVLFQADERKHLFGKLIRQLEARLAYLDPTDLSRLAWLYMHIGNEERAYTLAKRGLEMDSENDYCIRLVQKIG